MAPQRLGLWTYETFNLDLALIVMGLAIGAAQWLVLRQRLPWSWLWVAANLAGWGLLALVTGETLDQYGLISLAFFPACITAVTLAAMMQRAGNM